MDLTLLRHAPPHREYHGCYNGHTDIPIDVTLFEHDKIQTLLHRQFDRIYSSDLQRCTATLETMGITEFTPDLRLREVRFKPSIEGKTFSQIEASEDFDPRFLDSMETWHHYICDESLSIFKVRILSFLDELNRDENVLICAHGGTIRMILSLLSPATEDTPLEYLGHITISLG
ncbi:MAG: histidine phosphatase family protein [Sulfuricurvum sp.]|nr:histidine phosphatase family protein [Sulfuricurvum sp.]